MPASITSISSTLIDVPGVCQAVQHLQELGNRIRGSEFGFKQNDVGVVDNIIDCIHELALEVRKDHDKLETETINASVVRHRLQFLPALIKKETAAAIASARQSNANELERLQAALNRITGNIKSVTEKHRELEKSNSLLHPERNNLRQLHEDIIAQLNLQMAEKASKQISLNETRDKVRETNQRIVDLEEGIIQLKEDLIQERADARMEKKKLKKAVYDTTVKTREQKEINIDKKAEVDELYDRVTILDAQLSELRKTIRQMKTSKSKLEGQERALTGQFARQVHMNQDLRVKGLEIMREIEDQDALFEEEKLRLEKIIAEYAEDIEYEKGRSNKNFELRIRLQAAVKEKLKIRKIDQKKVSEQNKVLQKAKGELAIKAEELARLRQENIDMEERMIELNDTHEAIMATLTKQIQECKEALAKERKERIALQKSRDSGQKQMDDVKIETTQEINAMTRKINEGKKLHDDLTKQGQKLMASIKEDDEHIQQLMDEVAAYKAQLQGEKDVKLAEVDRMESEIERMTKQEVINKELIEKKTQPFKELEEKFEEAEKSYDSTKKEVIALKNKKLGLDESVKRTKRDIEKLIHPRQQLRYTVKARREDALKTLKKHNSEVKTVEENIYEVGKKLRTAMEENQRFKDANGKLTYDIAKLHSDMTSNKIQKEDLDKHFMDLREELQHSWEGDRNLEQEFCERDEKVMEELAILLDTTATREGVVDNITVKLEDELAVLSDFLDNIAKRRPKDGEQKKSVVGSNMTLSVKSPGPPPVGMDRQTLFRLLSSAKERREESTGSMEALDEVAQANSTAPLSPAPIHREVSTLSIPRPPLPAISENKK